jgi:hypothetical protein
VFYFGNAIGEVGNRAAAVRRRPADTRVDKADVKLTTRNRTRRKVGATAPITSPFDFDRNGIVDVLDRRIVAGNRTTKRGPSLGLIVAP